MKSAPRAFFIWFAAGASLLSLIPVLLHFQDQWFAARESFFRVPVVSSGSLLRLRKDTNGKGHFGASRNGGRRHQGIDLASSVGEPVLAAKSGRVRFAGYERGYGNWIELGHPRGLETRYAHLLSLAVEEGTWVSAGQLIGYSGKTGNADDPQILPHLHFEVRSGGQAVNPTKGLMDPSVILTY
ncbi:MAG: M23 family metallopeptidase [Candidatus Omnitrophota bacterium]